MHHNPYTLLRTVALLLTVITLCACGDSAASRAATAGETAGSKEVARPDSSSDECPYLSRADAEAVLGYRVDVRWYSTYSQCEFAPVGGERHGSGELIVGVMGPMDDAAADFADTREMAGDVEDVVDLGEGAFLYARELWVLSSPHQVVVRVDWYGDKFPEVREADIKIARQVLPKLQPD